MAYEAGDPRLRAVIIKLVTTPADALGVRQGEPAWTPAEVEALWVLIGFMDTTAGLAEEALRNVVAASPALARGGRLPELADAVKASFVRDYVGLPDDCVQAVAELFWDRLRLRPGFRYVPLAELVGDPGLRALLAEVGRLSRSNRASLERIGRPAGPPAGRDPWSPLREAVPRDGAWRPN